MNEEDRSKVKERFLVAYAVTGNISLSCKASGINRSTFYDWQEKDGEFSFKFHQAERDFADTILAEFVQRARDGYLKPVVSAGRMVYEDVPLLDQHGNQVIDELGRPISVERKPLMERVVSDSLLAMAVKRHFPEYKEKQQIDVNNMNDSKQKDQAFQDAVDSILDEHPDVKWKLAEVSREFNKGT